jgi:copper homeostasis protein
MSGIVLEVCVDDAAGIRAATEGGADRIELCAALALGGLSPSAGLIGLAARSAVASMVMIRPRAGDFIWSADEITAMQAEIAATRAAGLAGVVIGASNPDGTLDAPVLAVLCQAAAGLDITLHRAIDLTPDPCAALDLCAALGIRRVLSSGGAATALAGLARLAQMQEYAAGRVQVMPGGGVTPGVLATLAQTLPLREVHASCSVPLPAPADPKITAFGFQPPGARRTSATAVTALRQALDQLG